MSRKLSVEWTKHVRDPKAKADLEATIRNSTVALGRLRDIVKDRFNALNTKVSTSEYDNISWSHKQAHINGRKEELLELDQLLSFLEGARS